MKNLVGTARGGDLGSHATAFNTNRARRRAVIDLCIAFGVAILLLALNVTINFSDRIHTFFGQHASLSAAQWAVNLLFFWLAALLWLAFLRWRGSQRAVVELERVVSSICPDTLIVVNPKRGIVLCNPSIERMFGYTTDEVLGKQTGFLYSDRRINRTNSHEIHDALEEDGFHVGFAEGRRKNGTTVYLEIISGDLAGRQGAVLLLRDVSDRINAESERQAIEARMQEHQKLESLGVLAGGVAHDFNNVLMVVRGNVDLMMAEKERYPDLVDQLTDIDKACGSAAELCRQMLAYSGRGKFSIEDLSLTTIIRDMDRLLNVSLPRPITRECQLEDDLPSIRTDPTQIRQIVLNLVTNAADAIGTSPGTVTLKTGVLARKDLDLTRCLYGDEPSGTPFVFLEVADTGCGMDEDTRERMFEPFFTTKLTGRGLGLAAVHGLVRSMRGCIRVDTTPDAGTSITVVFPVNPGGDAVAGADRDHGDEWGGRGTVLVVDDEERVLQITNRMLARMGFSVVSARNGREGLDRFHEHREAIVCIVLDMTMPYMDGGRAFSEIRSLDAGVPVILVSGYVEAVGDLIKTDSRAEFVQKPYTFDLLREKVRHLVEGS